MAQKNGSRRVAIVAGLRTPFAKAGSVYKDLSALDLGKTVVAELMQRSGVSPDEVEQVVYGQVVPSLSAPNIAREIVLGTGMPKEIEAYSVSRACATSYQSAVNVAEAILAGTIDCGVAGGADSASDVPIAVSKKLADALILASRARSLGERLKAFSGLRPKDLVPVPPALKEPSTGLTMGQSAEKMAKENHISREEQDRFAHRSHSLAAQAWIDGRFEQEVMHVLVPPRYEAASEDKAKAGGFDVLGFIRSYAFAAVDPGWQMLMGPSFATPMALERAGLRLKDLDLIDMHEAFAAQVLSNTQAFESDTFARERLGRDQKIGEIDWDKFNVTGGSIAIGHPFAATGARQITQTLNELRRRKGELALCTACAAGGLGAAIVLEAA